MQLHRTHILEAGAVQVDSVGPLFKRGMGDRVITGLDGQI